MTAFSCPFQPFRQPQHQKRVRWAAKWGNEILLTCLSLFRNSLSPLPRTTIQPSQLRLCRTSISPGLFLFLCSTSSTNSRRCQLVVVVTPHWLRVCLCAHVCMLWGHTLCSSSSSSCFQLTVAAAVAQVFGQMAFPSCSTNQFYASFWSPTGWSRVREYLGEGICACRCFDDCCFHCYCCCGCQCCLTGLIDFAASGCNVRRYEWHLATFAFEFSRFWGHVTRHFKIM